MWVGFVLGIFAVIAFFGWAAISASNSQLKIQEAQNRRDYEYKNERDFKELKDTCIAWKDACSRKDIEIKDLTTTLNSWKEDYRRKANEIADLKENVNIQKEITKFLSENDVPRFNEVRDLMSKIITEELSVYMERFGTQEAFKEAYKLACNK